MVRMALPGARLHVFGKRVATQGPGIESHAPPKDSAEIFVRGSILIVPLRIASGARVRILEAWARGVPVIATPVAAAGLDITDGCGVRLATTPTEFLEALRELSGSPRTVERMVVEGRRVLEQSHDPAQVARQLERLYQSACQQGPRHADSQL